MTTVFDAAGEGSAKACWVLMRRARAAYAFQRTLQIIGIVCHDLYGFAGTFFPGHRRVLESIPIAASVDTAVAFRASYQAGQQCECSQAWPASSTP